MLECIAGMNSCTKMNRNAVPAAKKEPERRSGAFRSHCNPGVDALVDFYGRESSVLKVNVGERLHV